MNDFSLFQNSRVQTATIAVLVVLGLFLAAKLVTEVMNFGYVGSMPMTNTITVTGEGEVYAKADIASIVFTASEDKKTVGEAQALVTEKIDAALAFLESLAIEEKDIKTTSYGIYPKYEWSQVACTQFSCPPGKNELVGYTVSQTITVKVRDTESVGDILSGLAEAGITQVSGPDFTIDDDSALRAEARTEAIDDAKAQAEKLADALGVRLVRVVSFYENTNPIYPYAYGMGGDVAMAREEMVKTPSIPQGENKISSSVSITYEIR